MMAIRPSKKSRVPTRIISQPAKPIQPLQRLVAIGLPPSLYQRSAAASVEAVENEVRPTTGRQPAPCGRTWSPARPRGARARGCGPTLRGARRLDVQLERRGPCAPGRLCTPAPEQVVRDEGADRESRAGELDDAGSI